MGVDRGPHHTGDVAEHTQPADHDRGRHHAPSDGRGHDVAVADRAQGHHRPPQGVVEAGGGLGFDRPKGDRGGEHQRRDQAERSEQFRRRSAQRPGPPDEAKQAQEPEQTQQPNTLKKHTQGDRGQQVAEVARIAEVGPTILGDAQAQRPLAEKERAKTKLQAVVERVGVVVRGLQHHEHEQGDQQAVVDQAQHLMDALPWGRIGG